MDELEKRSARKEMERALDALIASKEIMEMGFVEQAQMLKSLYDSYIKSGFTQEQAFDLIKHKGLSV